jgi:hypothetical protein
MNFFLEIVGGIIGGQLFNDKVIYTFFFGIV